MGEIEQAQRDREREKREEREEREKRENDMVSKVTKAKQLKLFHAFWIVTKSMILSYYTVFLLETG